MTDKDTSDLLPCGCRFSTDDVTRAFIFIPHALDCDWYRYVLQRAAVQGTPVVTLDAR